MIYYVLVLLFLTRVSELVAQDLGSGDDRPANDSRSPQFIYMTRLHNKIVETQTQIAAVGEHSSNEGTLLATSFEADDATGQGMSVNGFEIAGGNILQLQFTIPKQKDATVIHKAELWIFPNMQSVSTRKQFEITFLATITFSHARTPRRESFTYFWKSNEECVPLDMTSLTRKISNNLRKRKLEKSNVTVQLEVVQARQYDITQGTGSHPGLGKDHLSICSALLTRTSNMPFLVVKYYEPSKENRFPVDGTVPLTKRSQLNTSSIPKASNCSLVSMVANLTEVYGTFVISPITIDVGDCQGSCKSNSLYKYSSHALLKERLKWINQDESDVSVCCVPTAFEHLELLIRDQSYLIIVEFSDMKAKSCGCR